MKIGVIGATGLVGSTLIDMIICEKAIDYTELLISASERSSGEKICKNGKELKLIPIEEMLKERPDIVFFMADEDVAGKYARQFTESGSVVIDNSSAFRLKEGVPLVVAGINEHTIGGAMLIANPNCSTIQLCLSIYPLIKEGYTIKELFVATYQSVSGAGKNGITQFIHEKEGKQSPVKAFPHFIFDNLISIYYIIYLFVNSCMW